MFTSVADVLSDSAQTTFGTFLTKNANSVNDKNEWVNSEGLKGKFKIL